MQIGALVFSAIFAIAILLAFTITTVIIRARLRAKGEIAHAFSLQLLQIKLPRALKNENDKVGVAELREKIALMEQVYSQLGTIKEKGFHAWLYGKPFFSIEIVVPHIGQEALFYLAVPRKYASAVEKMIEGVYPEAAIEPAKDYTIFHPDSAVAGAFVRSKNKSLPLRSYQNLESDPLASILNAFSKVASEGEGLALQIVAQKAPSHFNEYLSKIARHLKKGATLGKALSAAKESEVKKAFSPEKQTNEDSNGPVNEPLAEAVLRKSQKPLFATNIRVIASARNAPRAGGLFQELVIPLNQLVAEGMNDISINQLSGRNLQKLIYQFSFRTPDPASSSILSTEELSSIIHLPNTVIGSVNVASTKAKIVQAPFNTPKTGLLLGKNTFRGVETEIHMSEEDRARHFYVIGQTGTGKTYFMKNMIVQDIEAGHGVCFIDPHGDMAEQLLEYVPEHRLKDVIYFNPGDVSRPMGLNMLEYDPNFPEQKTFIINELLEIFNKLYDMKAAGGPIFEQYFRNATALVMDDPASGNTLLEINRVLTDKKFRDYKLTKTTNPLVKTFWRDMAEKAGGEASLQNVVPYISSKFDSFLSNDIMRPIVTQEKSAFRFREVMDSQKILLINLSKGRLGELNSSLIGLIMIGKILMAAFSRVDIPEKDRKPFYLYVDEFQNVTTNSIETILSEARKYKLDLTIAHQFIGQLSDEIKKAVFGNVGSMAVFRIGAEDGEFLEKQFAPNVSAADLINIDNYNCYLKLLIGGQTAPAFSMKTLLVKNGSAEMATKAKELSRQTYGRDKKEVELEIMAKFAALEKKPEPTTPRPLPPDF